MNIQFNPSYDLIIIVFVASFLILYFAYWGYSNSRKDFTLIILRSIVLLLLIFLIFNPTVEKKGNVKKNLPWHIYVDKSLSVKYHKQPSDIAYRNGIKSFLKKIKNKNISFETFSFGSVLDSIEEISKLKLNANSTNIGLIFNKIKNDYQKNLGGIVIFTDGQINQGLPVQQFHDIGDEIPIYVIGIGDTTPMLDVFIRSVNSPPISVKGDNVNIDVVISSIGDINERVNVNLFDSKNKLIGSKLITINGQEENEVIRFQIRLNEIGENNFFVKCSALSDEINIQNNQEKVRIHVMKDHYNVALVTGAPSYNTKLIKHFLKEQGNINVDHYVINSNNFNQKIKEFLEKKYEVIIFDNNPVQSNSQKWESVSRVFAKKIISHNSSFFIIPGPEVNLNSLNKYLKIMDLEAKMIDADMQVDMDWRFSKSWYDLYSVNNDKNSLNDFDSYPRQKPAFQLTDNSTDKLKISYAQYSNDKFENPLLILGEKQQIRYALWNSIDLASLKYMLSNSDLNFLFDNSMRKIINWLMKKSDSREFIFRTDKNSYQHGELISLSGVSSDLNNNFKINDAIVELYHNDKYISSKPLLYDLNDKSYKSEFWASKPGEITYVIKINKGLDSYEVSNGTFRVRESHIELNKIFLNENKLISLSESTGGFFRNWEEREDVISKIKDIKRVESYVSFFTFRHNYYYICLIMLLLSIEWFYRKKNRLI